MTETILYLYILKLMAQNQDENQNRIFLESPLKNTSKEVIKEVVKIFNSSDDFECKYVKAKSLFNQHGINFIKRPKLYHERYN